MSERKFYERGFNGSRWIAEITHWVEPAILVCVELKERLKIRAKQMALKGWAESKEIVRKLTPLDFFLGFVGGIAVVSASLVFFSGFFLLGYQGFLWLQSGTWTEFPLIVAFNYLFQGTALQAWLSDPDSWYGLHQIVVWILENMPLSLTLIMEGALMVLALLIIIMMGAFFRYYQVKNQVKKL
ncbi:MAG: hypothetical protein ACE5G9_00725 [Nitrospinales bacterium]